MNLESRMELHLLIYKIVSLRVICGSYDDSSSVRCKLEAETKKRISKLKDIERTTELQAAQSLYDMYEEKARSLAGVVSPSLTKRPEPARITLSV